MSFSPWLLLLIACILIFDFLNGFNDSGDIAATIIASRSMNMRAALTIAALAGFAGPFIFGVAVAKTIGNNIVMADSVNIRVLLAAVMGACIWSFITWAKGIPSSSSHALLGGLTGAVIVSVGINALITKGLLLVLVSLLLAPVAGIVLGWLTMKWLLHLVKDATPKANIVFKKGQIPAAVALAMANGANDSQKTMGIIVLGLISTGQQEHFAVPLWVIIICASTKSLGSFIGGRRVIRLVGTRFYKVKPIHSFASQLVSSVVIITLSLIGGPVSTTQVVSMSVVGAGAGERISKVRWKALKEILISWIWTIPFSAAAAVLCYGLIKIILP